MNKKGYRMMAHRLKVVSAITFRVIRQDIEKSLKDKGINISPLSLAVVRIVAHKQCTMVELSRHMMIAPASLVPVIDSLEKNGFLKRGSDLKDRRRIPLSVTKVGLNLLSRVSSISEDDMLVKTMEKLGEKKSKHLLKLSEELLTTLSGNKSICDSVCKITEKDMNN